MKKFTPIIAALTFVLLLSSCSKVIVVADSPVTGSWVLTDAVELRGNSWYTINTGFEDGTFRFYNSGSARYSDQYGTMTGSWRTAYVTGGYYDQYGHYYTDNHETLEINLSDYNGTSDLYFDDITMYGNYFIATIYNGHSVERYTFERY